MKQIARMFIALLLVMFLFLGISFWQVYPIKNFCYGFNKGVNMGSVYQSANEKGFYITSQKSKTDPVIIMNHESPFFRMGCMIESENGILKSASIIAGD